MRTMIHIEGVELEVPVTRLLRDKTRRFAEYVQAYERGVSQLNVRLCRDGTHGVLIDLDAVVEGTHLHVTKTSVDPALAIKEGTAALRRLFDKERTKRSSRVRDRAATRQKRFFNDQVSWQEYIDQAAATPSLNETIVAELPRLKFIITSELAHRIANGEIESGAIDPLEILDEAIAVDWPALNGSESGPVFRQILGDSLRLLEKKIKEWNLDSERFVSTDMDMMDSGPLSLSYLGDEILDFSIPDDDLRLGDITPDINAQNPEEVVANKEARKLLFGALTLIPRDMRIAFAASVLDDERLDDIGELMQKNREEVRELIAAAKLNLTQLLSSEDAALTAPIVERLYRGLGQTFRVDLNGLMRVH